MKGEEIKFKNSIKGFTLVEALVAISILMIAIASPMTLAQKGLSTAILSKDQMIASFLVQDAIEAVKNVRDQIAVSATTGDWLAGPLLPCVCTASENCNFDVSGFKFCTIDTTSLWNTDSIKSGNVNDAKLKISYTVPPIGEIKHFLKYDYIGSNGANGDEVSRFTRYINIKKTSMSYTDEFGILKYPEAIVNVRVFWDTPQGVQKIDVQNFIYNYSENL
jgi:type II secretory pathway pseudopilin PulG